MTIHLLGSFKDFGCVLTSFYLSLLGFLDMMHVIDAVLNSFAELFRSHGYPSAEKLYTVVSFMAGFSLRKKGDILQQRKLEEVEELRRVSDRNSNGT